MAVSTIDALYNGTSEKLTTSATGIDVTGTVTSDGLTVTQSGSTFTPSGQTVALFQRNSASGSGAKVCILAGNQSSSDLNFGDVDNEDQGAIKYEHNNDAMTFTTNGSERMRLDSSGKVGIGTTSPVTNLDVVTTSAGTRARIRSNTTSSPTAGLELCRGTTSTFGADAYTDFLIENINGGHLVFSTGESGSTTERMRISANGTKEFGAFKTENGGYNIKAGAADAGSYAARFDGTGTAASNVVQIVNGYGEVGSIKIASNGTTTNFNTGSDYRLKTDVQPVTNASARIQQLNPVNFEWIRSGTRTDGFLAHEAQAVVSDCVSGTHNEVKVWEDNEELPDGVSVGDNKTDDDGNTIPVYQGIDQSKLVPLLTAALQEALTEIASLKTRVEALEA